MRAHSYPCGEHSSIATLQHLLQLVVCCCFSSWNGKEKSYWVETVGPSRDCITNDVAVTHWSLAVSESVLYSSPWSPPGLHYTSSSPPQISWTALHAGRQQERMNQHIWYLGVCTKNLPQGLNLRTKTRLKTHQTKGNKQPWHWRSWERCGEHNYNRMW